MCPIIKLCNNLQTRTNKKKDRAWYGVVDDEDFYDDDDDDADDDDDDVDVFSVTDLLVQFL
jgi:hypothetical protein